MININLKLLLDNNDHHYINNLMTNFIFKFLVKTKFKLKYNITLHNEIYTILFLI